MRKVTVALLLIWSSFGWSHAGRQDVNGGHIDRATSEYHCHKVGCNQSDRLDAQPPASTVTSNSFVDDVGFDKSKILALLKNLKIDKENIPNSEPKYKRSLFPHWLDSDGDCEDTRAETLRNVSLVPPETDDHDKCLIDDGFWYDPYTDTVFRDDDFMDIDHIVPLKEAYRSGAYSWSKDKRKEFANDRENLIAVSLSANRSKSDKDPAKWMPVNKDFHCDYLYAWIYIKGKYQLQLDSSEFDFISNAANGC